jgi:hypothetical protein
MRAASGGAVVVALALIAIPQIGRGSTQHRARAAQAEVAVYPIAGSRLATPETQIAFRGVPADELGQITVTGSRSGAHAGRIEADSDGQGGSFLPTQSFLPSEVVTVETNLNIVGGQGGTYHFTIQNPAGNIPPPGRRAPAPRRRGDVLHFRSAPGLQPAAVRITKSSPAAAGGGDIFLTDMRGPVQWGPMIIDGTGKLVWFHPLGKNLTEPSDLKVQRYHGRSVLTFWQGWLNAGVGKGYDFIYDNHYRQIALVQAGNGLLADGHEFTITPQSTALIDAFRLVHWDASVKGGIKNAVLQDAVVQEIDIPTGLVLFQWDSLDHVPLSVSHTPYRGPHHPLDYFHVNSIQQLEGGKRLLIDSRNTWAVYEIDHRTGRVIWKLGGPGSTFKMGPGTSPAYQHHAVLHPGGLITMFDDGAAPQVHPQSRGLIDRINFKSKTVTLVRELDHVPKLVSRFMGSTQLLPGGKAFVGWGQQPYFTEYDAGGHEIFDGRFVDDNISYRAFRSQWHAQPAMPPALALRRGRHTTTVFVSWNGATDVTAWRVLAGSAPNALKPVRTVRKGGFETAINVHSKAQYFAVQALASGGHVLGTSQPHR